jgi:hypothetical protein
MLSIHASESVLPLFIIDQMRTIKVNTSCVRRDAIYI